MAEPDKTVSKTSSVSNLYLVLGLLLVAVAAGIYVWHKHNKPAVVGKSESAAGLPASELTTYKATKYGFSFSYPKTWSGPTINEFAQDPNQDDEIILSNSKSSYSVIADIKTGPTSNAPTKDQIQKTLAGDKSKFIKYDSNSYALAIADPKTKAPAQINLSQIISLPKLGVSSVVVEVSLNPDAKCPANKLAADGTTGCFTESDYANVSQFAKSFKPI